MACGSTRMTVWHLGKARQLIFKWLTTRHSSITDAVALRHALTAARYSLMLCIDPALTFPLTGFCFSVSSYNIQHLAGSSGNRKWGEKFWSEIVTHGSRVKTVGDRKTIEFSARGAIKTFYDSRLFGFRVASGYATVASWRILSTASGRFRLLHLLVCCLTIIRYAGVVCLSLFLEAVQCKNRQTACGFYCDRLFYRDSW